MVSNPSSIEVVEETAVIPAYRRISVGAIFAGAVVAIAAMAALALLGIAVGLALVDPYESTGYNQGIGMAAGVWWLLSAIIAFYLGAWVCSRLLASPSRRDTTLHGLATWGLATVALVWMASTTGGMMLTGGLGVLGDYSHTWTNGQHPMVSHTGSEANRQYSSRTSVSEIDNNYTQSTATSRDYTTSQDNTEVNRTTTVPSGTATPPAYDAPSVAIERNAASDYDTMEYGSVGSAQLDTRDPTYDPAVHAPSHSMTDSELAYSSGVAGSTNDRVTGSTDYESQADRNVVGQSGTPTLTDAEQRAAAEDAADVAAGAAAWTFAAMVLSLLAAFLGASGQTSYALPVVTERRLRTA